MSAFLPTVIDTETVSTTNNSSENRHSSYAPIASADGRYIVFASDADGIVKGDTNGKRDIFLYDHTTETVERVSTGNSDAESNDSSDTPYISADGRYIAFQSAASNLVEGDNNKRSDIFVYDRETDVTERVSVGVDGQESNGTSYSPTLSDDGRYVAFQSAASNLVEGDTNDESDIFLYDRTTNTTTRISTAGDRTQPDAPSVNPAISDNGRYVVFESFATNLVEGDTNGKNDIFVYDHQTNEIERISVTSDGDESNGFSLNPQASADGRYVTFESKADNLVDGDTNDASDIFLYDRQIDAIERISLGQSTQDNGHSITPSLSADGRYVTFASKASNLVADDRNGESDIFVYDRTTGKIAMVSTASRARGAQFATTPRLSADGRHITFASGLADDESEGITNALTTLNPLHDTVKSGGITSQSNSLLAVGGNAATQLTATITERTASEVSEVIMIAADDAEGSVEGYKPGTDGYLNAALSKATVVFSALEAGEFQELNPNRILDVIGGQSLQFAIITGGSLQELRQGGAGKVIFATGVANNGGASAIQTTALTDDSVQLEFRLPGKNSYQALTLQLAVGEASHAIGAYGQDASSRIIDLTGLDTPTINASIEVYREADLNNTVGFYTVEDEDGSVIDPVTGDLLAPDDPGYFQAALTHWAEEFELTGENGRTNRYSAELKTGQKLSSFIVVDGTVEQLVDTDVNNDPVVYFNHMGANSDGRDHVRLLGDNIFGYEDMVNGGDMDFDDVIVKVKLG